MVTAGHLIAARLPRGTPSWLVVAFGVLMLVVGAVNLVRPTLGRQRRDGNRAAAPSGAASSTTRTVGGLLIVFGIVIVVVGATR